MKTRVDKTSVILVIAITCIFCIGLLLATEFISMPSTRDLLFYQEMAKLYPER